jgi:ceroid-lipofuscinosis MFS transporter 7
MAEASKQQFLSYVVAIYSVGQFVGSLFFGFWSNRRRTIEPLLLSLVFLLAANMYYGFAQDFPITASFPRGWHVFIARFFVGFGAGNVAVARAFVSEGSTLETRNVAMTITGAAQGMGFVLGPAVGFAFTLMPNYQVGPIAINGYTCAGFASAFFSLINLILVPFMFRDIPHKSAHGTARVMAPRMTRSEAVAMLAVMWIFFVILTSFSVFETITGPLTQDFFGWGDEYNGLLVFSAGIFSVFVFIGLGLVTRKRKLDDRRMILFGAIFMLASNIVVIPFWGTSGLHLSQLILSSVFIAVGYPVASSITYALFSKVIHPVAQGDKMGYLTACGSLARMIGPIWATALYMSSLPVPACVVPSNSTLANFTLHNKTFCETTEHMMPLAPPARPVMLTGGEVPTAYVFGVRGYPGAWMFVVLGSLMLFTVVFMLLLWRRLVPHPDSLRTQMTTNDGSADEDKALIN